MSSRRTLTDKAVAGIGPAPAGKRIEAWDTLVPGLALRVTDKGAKSWIVLRRAEGRLIRLTLGKYPALSVASARIEARKVLEGLALGQDPREGKSQRRLTFGEFAQRYLADHAKLHKKARTLIEDERNLKRHVLPALGHLRLSAIDRAAVARMHAAGRARPINANRCLALVSHMLTMAEKWGLRPDGSNPCRHVERYPEKARERFLTADEIARLGEVLAETERSRSEPLAALAAIRLLVLTGARLSEILTLQWKFLDLERRTARLPDTKTGPRTVALGAPALALLASLPRIDGNPYVLPGRRPGGHLVGIQRVWERLRAKAGLEDVRLHDLRHSFASVAVAAGDSLFLVGKVLGHSQAQTTERYAHLAHDPLLAVADKTAGAIDALMRQKPAAEILPLPSPRRRG